jgi:uncharacterized membrane protein
VSQIETVVQINQPIEVVFDYLADLRHMTEWAQGITEASLVTGQTGKAGTAYNVVGLVAGRRIAMPLQITGGDPPHFYTSLSQFGPFFVDDRWEFTPVGSGTQVRQITTMRADGILGLVSGLVAKLFHKRLADDLRRAKQRLEAAR